ncbi:MAG: hypothetical protein ACRCYY_07715 [Trueperaceae bacterium]
MNMATKTRFSDMVLENRQISMSAKGLFLTLGYLGNSCTLEQLKGMCSNPESELHQILEELRQVEYISLEDGRINVKAPSSFGVGD